MEKLYNRFIGNSIDNTEKVKISRKLDLKKFENTKDVCCQTTNNYSVRFTKPRQLLNSVQSVNNYSSKILSEFLKYSHNNVVVSDATHNDVAIINDLLVKGNVFVGNILLTPNTVQVKVTSESNTEVELVLDGNHGNVIMYIQYPITVTIKIVKYLDRHHGNFVFVNQSSGNVSVDMSQFSYFDDTEVFNIEKETLTHIMYFVKQDKVLIRIPEDRKQCIPLPYHMIDVNDMKNVLRQKLQTIDGKDLFPDVKENSILTHSKEGVEWKIVKELYDSVEITPATQIISFGDVDDEYAKQIDINFPNDYTETQVYIKNIQSDKSFEGLMNFNTHKNLNICFLNGYVGFDGEYDITENTTFWFYHFANSLTLIRKI